jgi:N-acetylneuraminic acid mutarotase
MKIIKALPFLPLVAVGFMSCHNGSSSTVTGNWVSKSTLDGVARSEAVSFVVNDSAYVATGYDGNVRLNDVWMYNATGDYWIQKDTFPGTPRSSAVAFAVGNYAYLGTGFDGVNRLNDMWQYDPMSNSWTQKNNFGGTARYDAVAFGIGNYGYIGTGFDGSYLKDFYQYDPTADSWTQIYGFGGEKRTAAVAFVYNNKGYIVTGVDNGTEVNDFWSFDPSSNTWTALRDISNVSTESYDDNYTNIIRDNGAAFIVGDKAYVSTGEINGALTTTTWEYDFATDLWTSKQAYEGAARQGANGFSISQGGYLGMGRSSTFAFDDLRQFFPDQAYNAND